MHPILARFGPFFVYSYTVVMAFALLSGLGMAVYFGKRDGLKSDQWIGGVLAAVITGLLFGRAFFVLANTAYYGENPNEILLLTQGGFSYHGTLIGCLLFLVLWTHLKGFDFGRLIQMLAPSLVVVSALGWLACWLDGCAYGREAAAGLLVADLPDSFGVFALRYSTQMIALAITLLILGLVIIIRYYRGCWWLPWLTLLLLSGSRFVITFMRGDPVPGIGDLRLDTIAEAGLIALCLAAITWFALVRRKKEQR